MTKFVYEWKHKITHNSSIPKHPHERRIGEIVMAYDAFLAIERSHGMRLFIIICFLQFPLHGFASWFAFNADHFISMEELRRFLRCRKCWTNVIRFTTHMDDIFICLFRHLCFEYEMARNCALSSAQDSQTNDKNYAFSHFFFFFQKLSNKWIYSESQLNSCIVQPET